MKSLRYFEQNDEYVILYDYTGTAKYPFMVETKISGHRHEEYFSSFFSACSAFNEIVKTIKIIEEV